MGFLTAGEVGDECVCESGRVTMRVRIRF